MNEAFTTLILCGAVPLAAAGLQAALRAALLVGALWTSDTAPVAKDRRSGR